MPANLNALIRYKTIDTCLSNKYRRWTIRDLIEACTEALGERMGRYMTISERTLRDDIRVMRSDILGFNAPIVQENGEYFYSDSKYSIFTVRIASDMQLEGIYEFLKELRTEIDHPKLDIIINRIHKIISGEKVPAKPAVILTSKIEEFPEPFEDETEYAQMEIIQKQKPKAAGKIVKRFIYDFKGILSKRIEKISMKKARKRKQRLFVWKVIFKAIK